MSIHRLSGSFVLPYSIRWTSFVQSSNWIRKGRASDWRSQWTEIRGGFVAWCRARTEPRMYIRRLDERVTLHEWRMKKKEWLMMMNEEGWTMNEEWQMITDECWMLTDAWRMKHPLSIMNDDWWVMIDERRVTMNDSNEICSTVTCNHTKGLYPIGRLWPYVFYVRSSSTMYNSVCALTLWRRMLWGLVVL